MSFVGPVLVPPLAPADRGVLGSGLPWAQQGGPGPWTPLALGSKLGAFYDERDITLVSGFVSVWGDQSGNGRHLEQTTASARPGTGTVAGRTVPDFGLISANNRYLVSQVGTLGDRYGTTGGGVWVVLDNTGETPGADGANAFSEDGIINTATTGGICLAWSTSGPRGYVYNGAAQNCARHAASVGLHLLELTYDGGGAGTASLRLDNDSATTDLAAASPLTLFGTAAQMRVGSNASTSLFYQGRIASIVFASSLLTAAEQATLRAYLAGKWGVTA